MEQIKLELTLDEVNNILAALGQQPYIKVAELIQKIQQQGASQLKGQTPLPAKNGKDLTNQAVVTENGK